MLGVELIRSLDLYSHWYASSFANKLAPFLMALARCPSRR